MKKFLFYKFHLKNQDEKYSEYKALGKEKYYLSKVYGIIKKLDQKYKFKKSLELGCADGSFSAKLREDFNFDTYGVDISSNAVKLANQNGVMAIVHNLEEKLPFEDDFFDLVIACEVIEHIYDTDYFLRETKRVLKKNGILILSTPNLVSLPNRIKMLTGKYPSFVPEYRVSKDTAGHIWAYTIPTLSKQLESHGFKILIKTSPNFTFPMVNPYIPYLFKNVAIRLGNFYPTLSSHMIIVSKK